MEFRILGPLEVLSDGRALDLGGQKHRALLALLLLEANRVVSRDRLIDALWEEEPPETAVKALQVYISQLRKQLGKDRLETKAPGYLLRVEHDELDLARFQRLQDEGALREALSLWRGPALADLGHQRFAQAEIARLEELRLACLEERIEQDLDGGRHAELVGELESLVNEHPLRERLRGQLMLCLYRSGRQAEALEVYQAARSALVEELGIEPGRELRERHQAILRQDPGLDLAAAAEPAAEARRGAFVGRESELAELLAGLDDAFAGAGRLFLLVGEPGIGKSRLAEELIAHGRARGASVLVGRCWEAGGAPAYWPWVQSLRAHVRETETAPLRSQLGAGAAELAQIVPELRERFPALPEPPAVESEGARIRLFDATAEFLRNVSESRPILLVLDDLHAADAPSLLLLRFLARELGSTRMLVIGTYRDVDPVPGEPLVETLAEVAREPGTRRIPLGGLSESEVGEYVELTASEIASPELVAALNEGTEGNPLFLGEIVRLLAVEGIGSESGAEVRLAVPQTVRDVIARRLAHLSQECHRLLVVASVLGREFDLDALARVDGVSEDDLLDRLDEAMAARVVTDVPGAPGRLRFAHVLIRDTLYEGLAGPRRVRLHRLAVEALEALHGEEPGPHLAERYEPLPGLLELPGFVWRRTPRPARFGLAVVAAAAVVGTVVAIPQIVSGKRQGATEERRADAVARVRAERRLRVDQAPHRGRATGAPRAPEAAREAAVVAALERAITADALARFRAGRLPGPPVSSTRCDAHSAQLSDLQPAARRAGGAVLKCLAATSVGTRPGGGRFAIGFEFLAAANWRRATFTWCKTNPPGRFGGGDRPAEVRLTRPCIDPSR